MVGTTWTRDELVERKAGQVSVGDRLLVGEQVCKVDRVDRAFFEVFITLEAAGLLRLAAAADVQVVAS